VALSRWIGIRARSRPTAAAAAVRCVPRRSYFHTGCRSDRDRQTKTGDRLRLGQPPRGQARLHGGAAPASALARQSAPRRHHSARHEPGDARDSQRTMVSSLDLRRAHRHPADTGNIRDAPDGETRRTHPGPTRMRCSFVHRTRPALHPSPRGREGVSVGLRLLEVVGAEGPSSRVVGRDDE